MDVGVLETECTLVGACTCISVILCDHQQLVIFPYTELLIISFCFLPHRTGPHKGVRRLKNACLFQKETGNCAHGHTRHTLDTTG